MSAVSRHLESSVAAVESLSGHLETLERWGRAIGTALARGGRLLAAGNGGSAAEAQHLTSELVGRYSTERKALSAIALHADTSALTAVANDYGFDASFARQVDAHGRPGDVLVAFSTSGRSTNILQAVQRAAASGLVTLAVTGPGPNPLGGASDECVAVDAPTTATVQEAHLVAVHLLCEAVDLAVAELDPDGYRKLGVVR